MSEITTRPMTAEDWPYVSKIYLEGIATEHATFQTTCPPYTAWDASHTKDCRLVVLDDGVIAGWAALHRVDPRWCYRGKVRKNQPFIIKSSWKNSGVAPCYPGDS